MNDKQTATGVKDKLAQHAIEKILAQHQVLKVTQPSLTKAELIAKLEKWVDKNIDAIISASLTIEGMP